MRRFALGLGRQPVRVFTEFVLVEFATAPVERPDEIDRRRPEVGLSRSLDRTFPSIFAAALSSRTRHIDGR
ncbi:MAG: hypothetical protein ABEH58_01520 [Haloplanus sp.]